MDISPITSVLCLKNYLTKYIAKQETKSDFLKKN